jgi:hypothetical protein
MWRSDAQRQQNISEKRTSVGTVHIMAVTACSTIKAAM